MTRLTLAAKRKKEDAVAPKAKRPAAALETPTLKDKAASHPPATGLSSRGSRAQPLEKPAPAAMPTPEALAFHAPANDPRAPEPPTILAAAASPVLTPAPSPPPTTTPAGRGSSAMPGALEEALSALDWLRDDLRGPDRRKASGRLELFSGWLQADLSDAKAAEERCRAAEAELKAVRDKQATRTRQLKEQEEVLKAREAAITDRDAELEQAAREQATECGCLEKLKEEVESAQASHTKLVAEDEARLETREKLLATVEEAVAMRRDASESLELRSHKALQDLYGSGYEKPLVTPEEGPTGLLLKLVAALEGIIVGVGPMVEGEARTLSTSAPTRVFNLLYIRDPRFDIGAFLELVDPELYTAAAEAVQDQLEALLRKFLTVDPVTTTDGQDGNGFFHDGAPQAGDGGAQG
nr:MAP7 domain-containing protein 1-like [Aegilops tauschii subsp. strangulata]